MTEEESNKNKGGMARKYEIAEPEIVAPDGGWGWVIVVASFFMHLIGGYYHDDIYIVTKSEYVIIVWGICYTFGMFLGKFMETFGTSRSATSMIGSIQMSITCFVGPIAANLVGQFGCRVIAIAGSIISATSIILSGVAPNIPTLCITAGLFTGNLWTYGVNDKCIGKFSSPSLIGFGFGLIYLPAITCVAVYFDKKRAMATGIASCGAGFGTLIFAPIINLLNENFGWSWTLMIIGALVLFCIPMSLLFKPIKENNVHQSTETCEKTDGRGYSAKTHTGLAVIDCFGCISGCVSMMGKGYSDLLHDAKFILFMLSNLLTNIGFAVPFAYTVVILKRKIIL